MKVRAHVAYPGFRLRLTEHRELLQPWKGTAYRVTSLDYPNPKSILLGEGSFRYGGRWNARGSFRAVYGSTTDLVAVAESRANAEYAGIPYTIRTPRLLIAIEFDLSEVLDLTSSVTQRLVGLAPEEMQEDWRKVQNDDRESVTQAFGRAATDAGVNAILVPSARIAGGVNIAYFPENKTRQGEAEVCEPGRLERIKGLE